MALVLVLDKYTSEFPEDVILTKWLDDEWAPDGTALKVFEVSNIQFLLL